MVKKKICPGCHGMGVQYSQKEGVRVTCPVCYGEGEVEVEKGGTWY